MHLEAPMLSQECINCPSARIVGLRSLEDEHSHNKYVVDLATRCCGVRGSSCSTIGKLYSRADVELGNDVTIPKDIGTSVAKEWTRGGRFVRSVVRLACGAKSPQGSGILQRPEPAAAKPKVAFRHRLLQLCYLSPLHSP